MSAHFEEKKGKNEKIRLRSDSESEYEYDCNSDFDCANENATDDKKADSVRACEPQLSPASTTGGKADDDDEPTAESDLERPLQSAALISRAKPRHFVGYCALFFWTLPLLIAVIALLGDPAAWPFFKAQFLDGATPEAIADYTQALKVRPNMDILSHRAMLYGRLGLIDEQVADYRELLKNNVVGANGEICRELAQSIVEREGVTDEVITLLRRAAAASRPGESLFPYTLMSYRALYQTNYDLLNCEDEKTIKALSQLKWIDSGLTEDEAAFLRALALRELGRDKECINELDVIHGDYYARSDLGYRLYCFKALWALDHSNAKAAEGYLKEYSEKIGKKRKSLRPNALVNLTTAWLLYSQGKYTEALKATDIVAKIFADDQGYMYISSYQVEAANHLLRAHILQKLNRTAAAQKELEAYQESRCRGALFVPKVYRKWIDIANAG